MNKVSVKAATFSFRVHDGGSISLKEFLNQ